MKKCYNQLEGWVKHRMVPLLEPGHSTPVSYGHLQSIWLGGLVKPHALFAALRQEKAILAKCLADQARFTLNLQNLMHLLNLIYLRVSLFCPTTLSNR